MSRQTGTLEAPEANEDILSFYRVASNYWLRQQKEGIHIREMDEPIKEKTYEYNNTGKPINMGNIEDMENPEDLIKFLDYTRQNAEDMNQYYIGSIYKEYMLLAMDMSIERIMNMDIDKMDSLLYYLQEINYLLTGRLPDELSELYESLLDTPVADTPSWVDKVEPLKNKYYLSYRFRQEYSKT